MFLRTSIIFPGDWKEGRGPQLRKPRSRILAFVCEFEPDRDEVSGFFREREKPHVPFPSEGQYSHGLLNLTLRYPWQLGYEKGS